ncbi:glycosyltransferase WbuB [Lysobacteraceae bacterium NML91-0213]|nr:glycosyltransferase WbuB [Xanthomonadaceae bacterium NML91-0213]
MRLLVIVDTYVPARISGALQMRDLVREMRAQGHDPTVVVPAPEQTEGWRIEHVDGVEVLRVKTLQTKDIGKARRALAEWWLPYGLLQGLRRSPLAATQWDGLVWYSPTIFLGPMVRALKRQWGARGYLILRDLFPDWTVDAGIMRKGLVYRWFKRVERQQYAVADVIGVQTPANAALVRLDSPPGASIEVLNNWLAAPPATASSIDLATGPLAGRTVFAYTGNMGVAQGMDCLVDLALRLRDREDVGFLFVGRGSEVPRLRRIVTEQGLENVMFVDEVDAHEIPGLLAQCHVGLIALDPRHTTHNIPGKLLTYLHAGLPVLARINAGNDLEDLIHSEGVGLAVSGDDQDRLLAHACTMVDDAVARERMACKGRELGQRMFSPAQAVRQVIAGLQPTGARP